MDEDEVAHEERRAHGKTQPGGVDPTGEDELTGMIQKKGLIKREDRAADRRLKQKRRPSSQHRNGRHVDEPGLI